MTKLEEKLIELGYKKNVNFIIGGYIWWKGDKYEHGVGLRRIYVDDYHTKIKRHEIGVHLETQEEFDKLQQGFNEFLKEVESLKEVLKYESVSSNYARRI